MSREEVKRIKDLDWDNHPQGHKQKNQSEPGPTEFTDKSHGDLHFTETLNRKWCLEACDIIDRLTASQIIFETMVKGLREEIETYDVALTERQEKIEQLQSQLKAKNEEIDSLKNDLLSFSACHGHDGLCNKCKSRIEQALKGK